MMWNDVLDLPLDQLFMYESCGPRPDYLCMDGVSIGILTDKVQKEGNLFTPVSSPEFLDAPGYSDRQIIKTKESRNLVSKACEKEEFPNIKPMHIKQDPGLQIVSDLINDIKSEGYRSMPTEIADLLSEVTNVSSIISIFQVVDRELMQNIREILLDDQQELMIDPKNLRLKQEMFETSWG